MDAKVVLITGCSSGIGLSLAVQLASDPQKAFKGNQSCHRPVKIICCVGWRIEFGLFSDPTLPGEGYSPVRLLW